MIDVVKKFFSKATAEVSKGANQNTAHDIRVATCALFVEIARIDEKFTDAEMETILSILKEKYGLSPEHADALIIEAEKELDKRNFSRKILAMDLLEKLDEKDKRSSKKGAYFYRFDKKKYIELVKNGLNFVI